jgi:hypothetical protein
MSEKWNLLLSAIRSGDVDLFQSVLNKYSDQFQADRTFTLILRLHHNVIKTAIRLVWQSGISVMMLRYFAKKWKKKSAFVSNNSYVENGHNVTENPDRNIDALVLKNKNRRLINV